MRCVDVRLLKEVSAKPGVVLQTIKSDEGHLLRLTRKTEMAHEKADGFNTLFYTKIMKCEASVFGGTKDDSPAHSAIVAHLFQCSCYHGTLEAIELAVGEVAYSKGVANAAQKNGGVIYPGALRGYVAESESSTMISGFLF